MLVAIDAGHGKNTSGNRCAKELDVNETREWQLNARVAEYVVDALDKHGITAMRVDDITGKYDISLKERCEEANDYFAKLYISIHHNAGAYLREGVGGIVVFHYPSDSNEEKAKRLYDLLIAETGLKGNRAKPIVANRSLAVLKNTKMPAFLIELGFMDSPDDVPIILSEEHAQNAARAIVQFVLEMQSGNKCKCNCDCEFC